jgi:hypothetical protein
VYATDSLEFVTRESEITQRLSKPVLKGRGFTDGERGVNEKLVDDPKARVGCINEVSYTDFKINV